MPLLILVMPFEAFLPSLQDYALSVLVGSSSTRTQLPVILFKSFLFKVQMIVCVRIHILI